MSEKCALHNVKAVDSTVRIQTLKMGSHVSSCVFGLFLNWFFEEWKLLTWTAFSKASEGSTHRSWTSEYLQWMGRCMKRCHLGLCLLSASTFQCRSIFVLILGHKATVNNSFYRDRRGKKETHHHSHFSFREEEGGEGAKIRFTHNSGKDNTGFVQLSPSQNNHFLFLYEDLHTGGSMRE